MSIRTNTKPLIDVKIKDVSAYLNKAESKRVRERARKEAIVYGVSYLHRAFSVCLACNEDGSYEIMGFGVSFTALEGADRAARLARVGRAA